VRSPVISSGCCPQRCPVSGAGAGTAIMFWIGTIGCSASSYGAGCAIGGGGGTFSPASDCVFNKMLVGRFI
jgi:hypothetical protein